MDEETARLAADFARLNHQYFALRTLTEALLASHPDPASLVAALDVHHEKFVASALASRIPDATRDFVKKRVLEARAAAVVRVLSAPKRSRSPRAPKKK